MPERPAGRIGLYDPTYEHDACGVAMVAKLDGVAEPRDGRPRDRRAREPRAPRCRRRRPEHGRRRGHPAAAARRVHARRDRRRAARRPAPTASASASSRARTSAARSSSSCSRQTVTDEGQRVIALARRAGRQGLRRHHGQPLRALRQAARGGRVSDELAADQDAFERKLYVIRRVAEIAAGPELVIPSFSSAGRSSTRACSPARSCSATTPTCRTRGRRRRWRSCTRASPRTRSRAGSSPTRTG